MFEVYSRLDFGSIAPLLIGESETEGMKIGMEGRAAISRLVGDVTEALMVVWRQRFCLGVWDFSGVSSKIAIASTPILRQDY